MPRFTEKVFNRLSKTIYIELSFDLVKIRNLKTGKTWEGEPVIVIDDNSSKRLIHSAGTSRTALQPGQKLYWGIEKKSSEIVHSEYLEEILKAGIWTLHTREWMAPRCVLQMPTDPMLRDKLAVIGAVLFKTGMRSVYVHRGLPLNSLNDVVRIESKLVEMKSPD